MTDRKGLIEVETDGRMGYVKDVGKAVLWGLALAGIAAVLFLLIGLISSKGILAGAIQIVRSGLLMLGAGALFLLAGMVLMKKGGLPDKGKAEWKRQFSKLIPAQVTAIIAVSVLAVAVVVDYIAFYFI